MAGVRAIRMMVRPVIRRSTGRRAAEAAFRRFAERLPETSRLRRHRVDMVLDADISRRIARYTGVRHEASQALLIGSGRRILRHASHRSTDERALVEAMTFRDSQT